MEKIYYVEKSTTKENELYYLVKELGQAINYQEKLNELIVDKDYLVFRFYTEYLNNVDVNLLNEIELSYKVIVEKLTISNFIFNTNELIHEITVTYDLINNWIFEFKYYTDELNMHFDREIYNGPVERKYTFLNINFNEEVIPTLFQKIINHIFVTKQESNTFRFNDKNEIISVE